MGTSRLSCVWTCLYIKDINFTINMGTSENFNCKKVHVEFKGVCCVSGVK